MRQANAVGVPAVAALLLLAMAARPACAQPSKTWRYGTWSSRTPFSSAAGEVINYYLFTPTVAAEGRKLPLVVWLHGGMRANGVGSPTFPQDAFYRDEHQKDHPAFCLRPVAIVGQNWATPRGAGTGSHKMPAQPSKSLQAVIELIDKVSRENPIDEARLYVVGASMGGYGTWDLIQRFPKKFAAAIPICGGADPSRADSIKGMGIWIFHGDRDPFVPVRASREMFAALLKARGEEPVVQDTPAAVFRASRDGRIRYTEYKRAGHNPAWDNGLAEPDIANWLFRHTRAPGEQKAGGHATSAPSSRPAPPPGSGRAD